MTPAGEAGSPLRPDVGDFGAYMRSALRLRESIRRNRADAEFADADGHEIIYVFDANVFLFYADLEERMLYTRDFQQLLGDDASDALIAVMERLTAGFLFSGALPGQAQPGFITIPHFGEVLGRVERVARKLARNDDITTRPAIGATSRARIAEILKDESLAPVAKLGLLGDVVPSWLLSTLNKSAHFTRTLRAAFVDGEGKLVPLDRRDWGQDAARGADDELEYWRGVLGANGDRSENIRDDAIALQTMVNLYRANADTEDAGKRLYLFVTSDDGLAKAVTARAVDLQAEGIPDFIRLPRDYLPLLNLNAMAHAFGGDGVDPAMRDAFRRVFDALGSALDWVTLPLRDIGRWGSTDLSPLRDLRAAWISASQYATVLNAPRLADAAGPVLEELAAFLDSEGGTAAGLVEESLIEVRERHVGLLIDGALQDLAAVRGQPGGQDHRRVVIQLIGDVFGNLVPPGVSISDFLDRTVRDGRLPDATYALLTADPSRFEAQMLACAMLVAAERWVPAVQFGMRAVELAGNFMINRAGARSEASYLLALCLRYSMRGAAQFRRAQNLLTSNLKLHAARPDASLPYFLRRLRDDMELGTLHLSAAVNQELSRLDRTHALTAGVGRLALVEDASSAPLFRMGADRLSQARAAYQDSLPLRFEELHIERKQAEQLADWISSFSAINLVGAYIFERIVPGLQTGRPAVLEVADAMRELEQGMAESEKLGREARPIQAIYYWAARILEARLASDREEAAVRLGEVLAKADAMDHRPVGDRLETDYLKAWLADEHGVSC